MIHTYATTLDEWAVTQDQTTDFKRAYDRYKEFEREEAMMVEIPVYRGEVEMKILFHQWELDLNGTLYLAFTTRKSGMVHRRPVGTIKLLKG